MPMLKNVTGLDLGSDSIKAVELKQALRGLEPVQMRIHPRASAEIDLGEQVQHFLNQNEFSTEYVTSAIPGQLLSNRILEFPFRDRKKLTQAVPFQIEGDIPFEMEDVLVEWQTIGGDRNRAMVSASVAQRRHVSDLIEDLTQAGAPPRVVEASGSVLANLAGLFELDGSRALVDLGHSQTTICLLRDGQPIGSRTVPVGGHAITLAMARDRGLDPMDAERLKCEQGIFDSGFESPYPNAVTALDRIAREILRSVEASSSTLMESISPSMFEITLMGGGAHLKNISEYLSERTGIAASLLSVPAEGDDLELLSGGDPVLFGPAIALALRGTPRSVTQCNFRKEDFAFKSDYGWLKSKEMRPTLVLGGITLLLLAASSAASISTETGRAEKLEKQLAGEYAQIFPGQALPSRPVAAMRRAVEDARERADFLGLYGGNLSALDLLTILSEQIPEDLKIRFEEVNIDRNVIRIKVIAENYEAQDRMENLLKTQPVFLEADVSGSAKRMKDGSVSFGVSIPLQQLGDES